MAQPDLDARQELGDDLTITDDDNPPTIRFNRTLYTVLENAVSIALTVELGAVSGKTVTADYGTSDPTATAGSDHTATSGPVAFAPGNTSQTISAAILPDGSDEFNENFTIARLNLVSATAGSPTAVPVTILDADNPPTVHPY